ncbi:MULTISPECIES: rhodanese-like domain-containing protein [unclassified Gemella]|uniref:rhodanese-like domain-containing protein n=1 Tax=unclassified Gemella TaxID=2624949 RepID=UPI001C04CC78|nr:MULTISPECIES: rhodanese-like domain-containing protein [unclassified Gemella]MBU0278504.1 rhodanese-like domain-containing protein [Gemella sp. zg-1178]QWQ39458.1 rhodanese-like domain-containing protein [Gemella sp. zg-570]
MQFLISLLIIILIFAIVGGYNYLRVSKAVTKLPYIEFKKNIRSVQLVDVREKDEFQYAHINGARNIPLSQLSFKYSSLLKDKPIYLCDKNGTVAPRAALALKKYGYTNIYMLKNGLQAWEENLKTKK